MCNRYLVELYATVSLNNLLFTACWTSFRALALLFMNVSATHNIHSPRPAAQVTLSAIRVLEVRHSSDLPPCREPVGAEQQARLVKSSATYLKSFADAFVIDLRLVTLPQLIHDNWAGILHSVSRLAASFVDRDMKRDYTLMQAAKMSLYILRSCLLCRQAAADAVCLAFGRFGPNFAMQHLCKSQTCQQTGNSKVKLRQFA